MKIRIAVFASVLAPLACSRTPPEKNNDERVTPKQGKATPMAETAEQPLPAPDKAALLKYLEHADYTEWNTFPVEDPPPIRLGLPVHGRWVTTYANPTAYRALIKATQPDELDERVKMPRGSIIVKENRFKAPDGPPGVLTVMYKPMDPEYCQSGDRFNGRDCFGGDWMYVFHELPGTPLDKGHPDLDDDVNPRPFCMDCHAAGAADDYVRSLQRRRRALQPSLREALAGTRPAPPVDDPFCEAITLKPDLPADVAIDPRTIFAEEKDTGIAKTKAQRLFDCVSWKTFVALNWPRDPDARGEPDPKAAAIWSAADEGPEGARTRVWETYKEVYEVFQSGSDRAGWNPSAPAQPWDRSQPDPVGVGCDQVGGDKLISMITKNRVAEVENEIGQAFAGQFGTLVDRNGRLVRYDVRFNRSEFEFIIDNQYATTKTLTPSGPMSVLPTAMALPDNRSEKYGEWGGAIEVKGAWRELVPQAECNKPECEFPDDPEDYFHQQVWIFEPASEGKPAKCRQTTMGLVGLHVAHKTHWAPQWIWSTFEHVDNVPGNEGGPLDPSSWKENKAFYSAQCPDEVAGLKPDCAHRPFLGAAPCCANAPYDRLQYPDQTRNQVTRLSPIGSGAQQLNAAFAEKLAGTPFANYVLVDTQWPKFGRTADGTQMYTKPCNSDPLVEPQSGECFDIVPQTLRNTSMESYMATYVGEAIGGGTGDIHQISNRGCMNCHGEAGADFSYLWLDGSNQRVPSVE
ncbi:MAG: hypothetical protein AAF799_34395 [Myxococcota bacterium]